MSVLNGSFAPETLCPDDDPFGKPFRLINKLPLEGAMDAAAYGKHIVAAGRGRLVIYDLSGGKPELIGELDRLGDSRQLAVSDGFAYLTARADGLYIIELRDASPALAGHIDTLELATGVCCADGIAAVTNRHMGCELFDVRDPYHPERLGDFICGEAQSVWLYDNLALVSDWMNKRIRLFDITNPRAAKEISRFSVDGFADGVCVFHTAPDLLHPSGRIICAAATGHHSAKLKNRRKYNNYSYVTAEMLADGYGCGHGVEFYDVTDPSDPEYVSSLKAPPHFGGPDTWRIYAAGKLCYLTDSMGGLFEIDISDIARPKFTRRFRLPPKERQKLTPPSIQPICGAITGVALTDDYICAAGEGGIYLLDRRNGDDAQICGLQSPSARTSANLPAREYHNPDVKLIAKSGQIHSFVSIGGELLCAAGNRGIVASGSGRSLTDNICCDVALAGDIIIAAEADAGAAAYRYENGCLRLLDRIGFGAANPVREAVDFGGYLLLQLGSVKIQPVRFDGHFEKYCEALNIGMLYHRHIARTPAGAYPIALSLKPGPELLLPSDGGITRSGYNLGLETCPIEEGACGIGGGMILIFNRRYYYLPKPDDIAALPAPIGCDGAMLNGLPFLCGHRLVLLNRVTGRVEILDVSDPARPGFIKRIETGLYPEFAAEIDGRLLVACGHGGIIEVL